MSKLYIAYGSNLNVIQMAHRCPDSSIVAAGVLRNYHLVFRGLRAGVANVEPWARGTVPVLVWSISARDERALDAYEGFPHLYVKKDLLVETADDLISAMAYVMTPGHVISAPTTYYLDIIREGYDTAGFSKVKLDRAARNAGWYR